MSKIVAIIQAREGSRRLPGKSLMPLAGRPLILHVLERAQAIRGVGAVVCAIPAGDLALHQVFEAGGCETVVEGAAEDVLHRFVQVLSVVPGAQVIVRITGDCPLWAPDLGDALLARFQAEGVDYATNDTLTSGWPDGTDVEIFTRDLLERAHQEAKPHEREHVTPAMRRLAPVRMCTAERSAVDYRALKLSVDTQADLERVAAVMVHLTPGEFHFDATIEAAADAGIWPRLDRVWA